MPITFETFRGSADHKVVKGTTTKPNLSGTQVHIKTPAPESAGPTSTAPA
jgi:hypothetical protein